MNPRAGAVFQATRSWNDRLAKLANAADATMLRQAGEEREILVDGKPQLPPPDAAPEVTGRTAEDVKQEALPAAWQVVQGWRKKQAMEDWKGGDQVRTAIKLILKDSVKKVVGQDGKESFVTTLKPHEVRQLTQALADIQRIQRLAIGLSTENLGIDGPIVRAEGGHIEKNVTPKEEAIPTFTVEMSSRGKFLRPRPRRTN